VLDEVPKLGGEAFGRERADFAELTDRFLSRREDDDCPGAVLPDRRQQLVGVAAGDAELVLDAGSSLALGKQSLQDGTGVTDAVGLDPDRKAGRDDGGAHPVPTDSILGVSQPELTRTWFVERGDVDVVEPDGELVARGHQA
jgi:hypothetical protein